MVSARLIFVGIATTFAMQEGSALNMRGSNEGSLLVEVDTEISGGSNYVGCFKDASSRALPDGYKSDASLESCNEFCRDRGATYFGLQYYSQCFCGGSSYGKYGAISSSSCSTTCTHTPGVQCGGPWANSVYKVTHNKYPYVGCFKDASSRALSEGYKGDASLASCGVFCSDRGAKYFGLQHYSQCFCGSSSYDKYGALSASSCSTACTHTPGVQCGGSWANSVYKIEKSVVVGPRSSVGFTTADEKGQFLFGRNY